MPTPKMGLSKNIFRPIKFNSNRSTTDLEYIVSPEINKIARSASANIKSKNPQLRP